MRKDGYLIKLLILPQTCRCMCQIAIVDDHLILLDGLKWVVSQYAFVSGVDAFSSAEQLLEALGTGREYDLVITDLQMPGINGHELIDILQKHHAGTKILIMTMFDSPYVIKKVMESNANGFFVKQGDQTELEAALLAVLNGETYWPEEMKELADVKLADQIKLTRRESEILSLIADEQNTKAIAEQLFISEETVLTHRKNIMSKLDIHSTAGLVAFALKNNFSKS